MLTITIMIIDYNYQEKLRRNAQRRRAIESSVTEAKEGFPKGGAGSSAMGDCSDRTVEESNGSSLWDTMSGFCQSGVSGSEVKANRLVEA